MIFKVMSRSDARRYTYRPRINKLGIISITDPDKENAIFNFEHSSGIKTICRVKFADEEAGHPQCITEQDAQTIAQWVIVQSGNIDEIIVHCEAGICRSAGVCAAIQKWMMNDDSAIFTNPKYTPNMTCYRAVLNALVDAGGWKHL